MTTTATELTIDGHYCGPPGMANGGYVAGLLADEIGPSASIRFDAPVPIDRPITLQAGGGEAALFDGEQRLVRAVAHEGPPIPIESVSAEAAAQAALRHDPVELHPFPECYVCGPARAVGDGLRIIPGWTARGLVATPWCPGAVSERTVWAALDCPSAFASVPPGQPAVLGTITGVVTRAVAADEQLVVVGKSLAIEGRKRIAAAAVYDAADEPVAWAETIWIII